MKFKQMKFFLEIYDPHQRRASRAIVFKRIFIAPLEKEKHIIIEKQMIRSPIS